MSLTHRNWTCYREGCYAVITLHPDDERRLRETHETFYCPAGHKNCFSDETEKERSIRILEREVECAYKDVDEVRARLKLVAKAAQTCPLGCGWQGNRRLDYYDQGHDGKFLDRIGGDLADHLARKHDLEVKVVEGRLRAPDYEEATS